MPENSLNVENIGTLFLLENMSLKHKKPHSKFNQLCYFVPKTLILLI